MSEDKQIIKEEIKPVSWWGTNAVQKDLLVMLVISIHTELGHQSDFQKNTKTKKFSTKTAFFKKQQQQKKKQHKEHRSR